jgi:sugar/nucleoside kinase (ribokinase family)
VGAVEAVGFCGDDGEGYELRRALRGVGCETAGLLSLPDRLTPTYLKPRDTGNPGLAGEHERYDTKNRTPTPGAVQERLLAHLEQLLPGLDAVIVADQVEEAECGAVTARVRDGLARLAGSQPHKVFWADSRRRIGQFRDVIVKVNAAEATGWLRAPGSRLSDHGAARGTGERQTENGDPDDVRDAMVALRDRTGKPVFVTAGARGIWVSDPEPTLVPAVRVEGAIDPTGAGDSATAGAVLALGAGATLREAALVANLVASITIQQLATTGTASPLQLGPRLEMWRGQR